MRNDPAQTAWRRILRQHRPHAKSSLYSCGIVAYAAYRLNHWATALRWCRHGLALDPQAVDLLILTARIEAASDIATGAAQHAA